jgi:putative DNA primase/helicase
MSGVEDIRDRFAQAETVSPGEGLDPAPRTPDDGSAVGPPDPPELPPEEVAALAVEGAKLPLNDTGNGKRFALYFGETAMVVPRVGWHSWDGRRWARDPDDITVRRLAQRVQDRIIEEIPHLMLEDWQAAEIDREPDVRNQLALLKQVEPEARTHEQEIELEELGQRLQWIRKLKDRKSGMKSDHRSFAKTSGNKGRIDALLTEATVSLARDIEDLDADPLTLNTEAGLLRFQVTDMAEEGGGRAAEVELVPHARIVTMPGRNAPQLITKLMPVGYDPDATCPRFDAFLERVQPNPALRGFLQRWLGLSMTGLPIQKFAFFYGHGANGKSVLVDLVAKILGDYGATAKVESLTGRNRRGGGDATPDLIPLVGARMVRASEPEEGERLQEGTIKELTGGEPILVRQLHADFIEVRPIFKLTISGNHKPDIRGTDDGIWRRVLLVPFDVQIPPEERDEKLGEKLWEERAGIFNWLVEGLLQALEGGLAEPKEVLEATDEYRADSDPIGTFLRECCVVSGDPADFVTSRNLMDGFNLFLDQKGEGMWGARTISLKLKALAGRYRDPATGRMFTPGKMKVSGYRGIRFQDMFAKDFDAAPRNAGGHPVAYTARYGQADDEAPL